MSRHRWSQKDDALLREIFESTSKQFRERSTMFIKRRGFIQGLWAAVTYQYNLHSERYRTQKQCRERYKFHIIKKNNIPMDIDERNKLNELVLRYGRRWKFLTDFFENRTTLQLKNTWYSNRRWAHVGHVNDVDIDDCPFVTFEDVNNDNSDDDFVERNPINDSANIIDFNGIKKKTYKKKFITDDLGSTLYDTSDYNNEQFIDRCRRKRIRQTNPRILHTTTTTTTTSVSTTSISTLIPDHNHRMTALIHVALGELDMIL